MTRLEPPISDIARPFWDATREKRLVLQHCRSCDRAVHYPREACPRCLGGDLEWRPASGRGVVYAFTVNHVAGNPATESRAPYVVALVDLEEGVRMMTNIVGCEPGAVQVGMPVELAWEELSDGRSLPLFAPRAVG
jgi:uncharacterized OB-fold protein